MARPVGRVLLLALLACAGALGRSSAEHTLPLDSRAWTLTNENGSISLTTSLPAYPLEVLRAAGVIGDPLFRYGEQESRWVAMEQWSFSATISAAEATQLLEQQQVVLQLGGVDTFADISLNGQKILTVNNFHRQWAVPVKAALKADEPNTLAIVIKSAFKESLRLKQEYPYYIPTLYNTGSIGAYNFARKPAFDFGWDWGPALAASGIHGAVQLIGYSQPTLAGASLAQAPLDDSFKLTVTSRFYVPPSDGKGTLTISLPELQLTQQQELAFSGAELPASELIEVKVDSEVLVPKADVQLWWPAGGDYGPHKLYDVRIAFTPEGAACGATGGGDDSGAAPPAPADEPPADEPPADEPPADEPPADEPPADDAPADDTPAGDVPVGAVPQAAANAAPKGAGAAAGGDAASTAAALDAADAEGEEQDGGWGEASEDAELEAGRRRSRPGQRAEPRPSRRRLLEPSQPTAAAPVMFEQIYQTAAAAPPPPVLPVAMDPVVPVGGAHLGSGSFASAWPAGTPAAAPAPAPPAAALPGAPSSLPFGGSLSAGVPAVPAAGQAAAPLSGVAAAPAAVAGSASTLPGSGGDTGGSEADEAVLIQDKPSSTDGSGSDGSGTASALSGLLQVLGSLQQRRKPPTAAPSDGSAADDGAQGGADSGAQGGADSGQCSSLSKRIGFRTIELVMEPLPKAVEELFGGEKEAFEVNLTAPSIGGYQAKAEGKQWANNADGQWSYFEGSNVDVDGAVAESFYFKVNGIPIYAKGSNVIPLNVLPANVTPALISATLQAAVDSNQNMLRVWGGGLYHTEAFYDFADENGLLIWQDAMFGGSHYPRTKEWIDNYAEEIAQQAARLSWHPSVALWCGNNEIDLSYEWSNSTVLRSNRHQFVQDYVAVFIDTVRKQIKAVDPGTIFVDSSPAKGAIVDTPELYIKRWAWIGDPRYGSIHHYNYYSDCEDFRSYPAPKFVSEFGWQSYPLPETYADAMDPVTDWGVGNDMNEFRNRRSDVTPQFLRQFAMHFKLPDDWNPADAEERLRRFRSYLYIGNMQHMRCYETALNYWRRLRSDPKALTMGVMYWQLNDVWAGASWSSVDISGRWKPVHYAAKRAYAPLAVQAVRDGPQAQVFVVSDLVNTTRVAITLRLVSLSDTTRSCVGARKTEAIVRRFGADVPGLFASRVWTADVDELLAQRPGCNASSCYLAVTATAEGHEPSESQLWFTQFKNLDLPDPQISFSAMRLVSPIEISMTLRARRPAPLVLLSASRERVGHFTDNGFTLEPCAPRKVVFVSHNGLFTEDDLKQPELFTAESLFDHASWAPPPAADGDGAAGEEGLPRGALDVARARPGAADDEGEALFQADGGEEEVVEALEPAAPLPQHVARAPPQAHGRPQH